MAIMHWLTPEKVVLDAFTSDNAIYELAKITRSSQEKPYWWNKLPASSHTPELGSKVTMKSCNGFNDLYSNAFTIKAPCDFFVKKEQESISVAQSTDDFIACDAHDLQQQMGGNLFGDYSYNCKVHSQWFVATKSNINFLMTNHSWNIPKSVANVFAPNGIVNFKFGMGLNVNLILNPTHEGQVFKFDALMPIAMLLPLSEKRVQIKHHLISPEELTTKKNYDLKRLFFVNKFTKVKKEKAKQEKGKSCPFGFGKN